MATQKAISSNDYNNGIGQTILGVNTSLGIIEQYTSNVAGQFIKGVEATDPWGNQSVLQPQNTHPATELRVTSLPSGMNIDFDITVGDGLSSLTTALTDDELTGKGEFTYLYGNAGVLKDYNNLSS